MTANNFSCKLNHLSDELGEISYKPGNCFELLQSSTIALISQRVLARAMQIIWSSYRLNKLNLVQFFCFILAQYFGELRLDTLIEFI